MEMGQSERKGKALEKFVLELEKRLNDKIWGIYLFGSFAKGTAREGSDIDLLVVYSGIEERRFLEVVSEIGFNILMETEELIEVIPMLKEEYESSLGKSPFLWEVLRFGVPIFTRLKGTEWKLEFRDYLQLAEEYLRYAQDALKENKLRLVIDSGYNACELLIKMMIISRGKPLASSHGGIVNQFGKEFILTKRVPEHLGRDLHLALELKAKARYKPRAQFDVKDSEFVINLADELIFIAKRELEKEQNESQDQ